MMRRMTESDALTQFTDLTRAHADHPAGLWLAIADSLDGEVSVPQLDAMMGCDGRLIELVNALQPLNIESKWFVRAAEELEQGVEKRFIWSRLSGALTCQPKDRAALWEHTYAPAHPEFQVGSHPATAEQVKILKQAGAGQSLMIQAGAGASKTSTLAAIANYFPTPSLYLAFNRGIAEEARQRFPVDVVCRTLHALALRHLPDHLRGEQDLGSPQAQQSIAQQVIYGLGETEAAEHLNTILSKFENCQSERVKAEPIGQQLIALARGFYAAYVRQCDEALSSEDSSQVIAEALSLSFVSDKQAAFFETFEATVSLTQILNDLCAGEWSDFEEGRQAGYGFDEIMRWYALHGTALSIKRLYCDEVQDVNPVMLAVIERQIQAGTQVVLVGDTAQKIYGWNGAVNAFERLNSHRFETLTLSHSFRCGTRVTGLANAILKKAGHPLRLKAKGPGTGQPQWPKTGAIARTNAGVVQLAGQLASQGHKIWSPRPIDVRLIWNLFFLKTKSQAPDHPALAGFTKWSQIVLEKDRFMLPYDVALAVGLLEKDSKNFLANVKALKDNLVDQPAKANVAAMTAHTAKGLEFENVVLGGDFPALEEIAPDVEELNLLYVAVTRGMKSIGPPALARAIQEI